MKAPIGVLFLALAALAIPAVAEEPRVDPVVVTGAVVSSANDSLVVDGDDGTRRTFLVDPATTLATADLTAGARVVVQYRVVDGDRAQSLTVNLLDTGARAPALRRPRQRRPTRTTEARAAPWPQPGPCRSWAWPSWGWSRRACSCGSSCGEGTRRWAIFPCSFYDWGSAGRVR